MEKLKENEAASAATTASLSTDHSDPAISESSDANTRCCFLRWLRSLWNKFATRNVKKKRASVDKAPPDKRNVVESVVESDPPLEANDLGRLAILGNFRRQRITDCTIGQLADAVSALETQVVESEAKHRVIQQIIRGDVDLAAANYTDCQASLSTLSKREISMFSRRKLGNELVQAFFPGLPKPLSRQEHEAADIPSLEQLDWDLRKARHDLDRKLKAGG